MTRKPAVDAVNNTILGYFGISKPPLKWIKVTDNDLIVESPSGGCIYSLKFARLPRRITWFQSLFSSSTIDQKTGRVLDLKQRNIEAVDSTWLLDTPNLDEAIVIRHDGGKFALWSIHSDILIPLSLNPVPDTVFSSVVWSISSSSCLEASGSLVIVSSKNLLQVPLSSVGDKEFDTNTCYRLRLFDDLDSPSSSENNFSNKKTHNNLIQIVRVCRVSKDAVIFFCVTAGLKPILCAVEVRSGHIPVILAYYELGISLNDFLTFKIKEQIISIYLLHGKVLSTLLFDLEKNSFSDEINPTVKDEISDNFVVVKIFSSLYNCFPMAIFQNKENTRLINLCLGSVVANSNILIPVDQDMILDENLGVYSSTHNDSLTALFSWTKSSPPRSPQTLVDSFDIVKDLDPKRIPLSPILFSILYERVFAAKMTRFPGTWSEIRDIVERPCEGFEDLITLMTLYLQQVYQPEFSETYISANAVPRLLQIESSLMYSLDSDATFNVVSLFSSVPINHFILNSNVYRPVLRKKYGNSKAIEYFLNLSLHEENSEKVKSIFQGSNEQNIENNRSIISTPFPYSPTRVSSPQSPHFVRQDTSSTQQNCAILASPIKISAAKHHPKLPSRLSNLVNIIETPSPISSPRTAYSGKKTENSVSEMNGSRSIDSKSKSFSSPLSGKHIQRSLNFDEIPEELSRNETNLYPIKRPLTKVQDWIDSDLKGGRHSSPSKFSNLKEKSLEADIDLKSQVQTPLNEKNTTNLTPLKKSRRILPHVNSEDGTFSELGPDILGGQLSIEEENYMMAENSFYNSDDFESYETSHNMQISDHNNSRFKQTRKKNVRHRTSHSGDDPFSNISSELITSSEVIKVIDGPKLNIAPKFSKGHKSFGKKRSLREHAEKVQSQSIDGKSRQKKKNQKYHLDSSSTIDHNIGTIDKVIKSPVTRKKAALIKSPRSSTPRSPSKSKSFTMPAGHSIGIIDLKKSSDTHSPKSINSKLNIEKDSVTITDIKKAMMAPEMDQSPRLQNENLSSPRRSSRLSSTKSMMFSPKPSFEVNSKRSPDKLIDESRLKKSKQNSN